MDFLTKKDLIGSYKVNSYRTFEKLIGEKGKKILKWHAGQQRFSPKQIREIRKLIGEPLKREEKYA